MTISGENHVALKNLMVGEVWICSGQSNMEWKFKNDATADDERPKAKFPEIRMFNVWKKTTPEPREDLRGKWTECSPETVGDFSAVAYFFARELHAKLGVPIGMITSSSGGTQAQAWTSEKGFEGHSDLKRYVKFWESYRANPGENAGKKFTASDPSSLYNGMIAPLIPYRIKGVIWYQGESNSGKARRYRTLFPALIADWRANWNQGDFPFCFVQITPHKGMVPEIREAQFLTLSKSKNTAMVVTTDVGEADNIHPERKEPVGKRLALAARALAYGEKIEYSGPLFESMEVDGSRAVLTFSHIGSGLVAQGGELRGFTIAGPDDEDFVPAKAEISGGQVIVTAKGITRPKAARYGWENVRNVNLYNKEGLPASPFRAKIPKRGGIPNQRPACAKCRCPGA